jgi:hypothetical protein
MLKEKKIQHISEFSNYKELFRFKKDRSPHSVVFLTNDPQGWFINCVEYKTKSGMVSDNSIIIAKDLDNWIEWHRNLGWKDL